MSIYIGTSGWSYDHWQGVLYDPATPAIQRLQYYRNVFDTVELNASFYRWPRTATFIRWAKVLPDWFRMSVKAPRGLTHGKYLYAPEAWVERVSSDIQMLGTRRGVLLVQLPPNLPYDYARLAYFLRCLPPWLHTTIEFRHPSWHTEAVWSLLEQTGTAYCIMSGAHLPCILRATSSVVYVRLHGPDHQYLYAGSYSDDDLRWWAERIHEWHAQGRDVFVYFNNDGHGYAVHNARTLRWLVGV
jgi:uncharacterized protein YecE (DUF72 family)